jgi:hypothetical protein
MNVWRLKESSEGHDGNLWLANRLVPHDPGWVSAVEELHPEIDLGDELWRFDEPASHGINAGATGIALVRYGEPLRTTVTALH